MTFKQAIRRQFFCAFNIWDINSAKAVIETAGVAKTDIIIQTSVKTFKNIEPVSFRLAIHNLQSKAGIRAFLHLDHCDKEELCCEAINLGWDSVLFDGSQYSLEENIAKTNYVCAFAETRNAVVEAEIGVIKGVEEDLVFDSSESHSADEIVQFKKRINADLLGFDIGTSHGLYSAEPKIHFDLLEKVSQQTDIPLVVHGGSGLKPEVLREFLKYRVHKINFSTQLKEAYQLGLSQTAKSVIPGEILEPLKINEQLLTPLKRLIEEKLNIFK